MVNFRKLTDFIYPLSERERSTHPFMNDVADVMKSLPPSGDDLCSAPMTEAPEPSSPSASPACLKGSTDANDRHFSIVNAQNKGKEWNTGSDQFNVILNNDSQEREISATAELRLHLKNTATQPRSSSEPTEVATEQRPRVLQKALACN